MKKNLQEMEVKAINKSAILESHDGEEFSLITVAKNVLCEDGTTMQDYFDSHSEPNISTKIVNSNSMSKVGQGDNVDFSDNVMNGAYEDVVLKGKSLVNVIQEPSSQDVVLPYAFEDGQYVTINDTKESGALGVELKGQTLVNIHKSSTPTLRAAEQGWYENLTTASGEISFDVLSTPAGWRYINAGKLNYQMLKPNTKYLVVFESSQNISSIHFMRRDGLHGLAPSAVRVQNNKAIITTNSQIVANEQILYVNFYAEPNTKVSFKNPMIIEYVEGMENWDIPYFTGMASCKRPVLHTVGSLFDAQQIIPNNTFTYSHSTNTGRFEFTNRGDVVANTNIQLPAGTYDISFLVRGVCDNGRVAIAFAKDGQVWHGCSRVEVYYGRFGSTTFKEVKSQYTFDAPVTVTIVGHGWAGGATGSGWCEFKDIRFTPVGKTSILSLPEEVVLRSLSNGVRDTFNTRTGVYTQRIGEVILNGDASEEWINFRNSDENTVRCQLVKRDSARCADTETNMVCDKLKVVENSRWRNDEEQIERGHSDNYISIRILKSKLSSETLEGLKIYLQTNPITVQYELATPIITKINLSSTLKSWNTTTHIYSEIPENTLYPILSHANPTYPVILKPSTKYSIVANSYSNGHTNSAINFNLGGATVSTTVGNRVTTITTPSTLSNELLTMSGRGNKLNNVMVIEGDVVGDEPYFEGMCDSKSPILSNVGKNLFNPQKIIYPTNVTNLSIEGNCVYIADGTLNGWREIQMTASLPIGTYYVDILENGNFIEGRNGLWVRGVGATMLANVSNRQVFTITEPAVRIDLIIQNANNLTFNNTQYSIHIEKANTAPLVHSPHESYKSNILSCETYFDEATQSDKTIVLRSLPNGVCDTLNVETGEYVQRIGEIVLDGSEEGWTRDSSSIENSATNKFYISNYFKNAGFVSGVVDKSNLVCHKLSPVDMNTMQNSATMVYCIANSVAGSLNIRCPKSADSTNALKTWLRANPINVYCELATPIITTIDVQGFPYAYENGHILLESGSQEQSLTPTIEYSIVANRGGQIRSNQRMVERQQKKLDSLYAMTLVNMIDSQYKQVLMKLKSELGSEVRTWDIE